MLKAKDQKNYAMNILKEELTEREAEKATVEEVLAATMKRLSSIEEKIESLKTALGE